MIEYVLRILKKKIGEEKSKSQSQSIDFDLTLTFMKIIEEKGEIILWKLYF